MITRLKKYFKKHEISEHFHPSWFAMTMSWGVNAITLCSAWTRGDLSTMGSGQIFLNFSDFFFFVFCLFRSVQINIPYKSHQISDDKYDQTNSISSKYPHRHISHFYSSQARFVPNSRKYR